MISFLSKFLTKIRIKSLEDMIVDIRKNECWVREHNLVRRKTDQEMGITQIEQIIVQLKRLEIEINKLSQIKD